MVVAGLGTWAGLVTAICTMIIALFSLIVAVTTRRTKRTGEEVKQHTIEIHQIVNQQRTDMQRYQAVLIAALNARGIEIPQDQSTIDTSGK